jgi:hypothetical protein
MLTKRVISKGFLLTGLAVAFPLAMADNGASTQPTSTASAPKVALPPGITEEMLAPPPVPHFMLERRPQSLTIKEMAQQAHETNASVKTAPKLAN